jgi:hypothetical protein
MELPSVCIWLKARTEAKDVIVRAVSVAAFEAASCTAETFLANIKQQLYFGL